MKINLIFLVQVMFLWQPHWSTNGHGAEMKKNETIFRTLVTTEDITKNNASASGDREQQQRTTYRGSYIEMQVSEKPHNLYIGRCLKKDEELHREIILLNNDGKSHVTGNIRVNVNSPVDIKCVRVTDEDPSSGAYPSYLGGGVGFNFVEIGVQTRYGKGFKFFLQIFGKWRTNDTATGDDMGNH